MDFPALWTVPFLHGNGLTCWHKNSLPAWTECWPTAIVAASFPIYQQNGWILLFVLLPRDAMHNAAYAVVRCPSVRLPRSWIVSKRVNISDFFTFWCIRHSSFSAPNVMEIFRRRPPNGNVECRRGMKSRDFWPVSRFILKMIQDRAIVTMERIGSFIH